jgi:hypothetical protein
MVSVTDIKKPFLNKRLCKFLTGMPYLQFAQAHVEPQLQLTHVQFSLLHFTF